MKQKAHILNDRFFQRREFPGVSALYYLLDDTDKSNVGIFTIDLLLANGSLACEYTIWAVQGEKHKYVLL